jgi:hypothetical protein
VERHNLALADELCCLEVTQMSRDRDKLCLLDPTEKVLPDDGDRIQSPKRYVLKYKQDDILHKDETMDNIRERNGCKNL